MREELQLLLHRLWEAANIPSWQTISCSQSLTYHLYLISFRQIQDLSMRIWQRWQRCCGGSGGSPRPQVPQPKTNPRALRDQINYIHQIAIFRDLHVVLLGAEPFQLMIFRASQRIPLKYLSQPFRGTQWKRTCGRSQDQIHGSAQDAL